jgi:hypothetical protein
MRIDRSPAAVARRFASLAVLLLLVSGAAFGQASGGTAAAGSEPGADPALYAVGALGASNLYTTYFLLGTLADGYATAAYTATFADELARDVIGLNESAIDVLEALLEDDAITGEDQTLVSEMIRAHRLLINQAFGLIAYVEDSTDTEDWFAYRRQAWELITELLNID